MPMIVDYHKLEILSKDLKDREIQVLFLIANGKTNEEAGSIMYLSPDTIKSDIKHAVEKLGFDNRTKAVYTVTKMGIFDEHADLLDEFIDKI